MPYTLHIPGEPARALRWTTAHPASSYGGGVLLYRNGKDMLDGATFRALRDGRGRPGKHPSEFGTAGRRETSVGHPHRRERSTAGHLYARGQQGEATR